MTQTTEIESAVKMNYFIFGTNDMSSATKFYNELFGGRGAKLRFAE